MIILALKSCKEAYILNRVNLKDKIFIKIMLKVNIILGAIMQMECKNCHCRLFISVLGLIVKFHVLVLLRITRVGEFHTVLPSTLRFQVLVDDNSREYDGKKDADGGKPTEEAG